MAFCNYEWLTKRFANYNNVNCNLSTCRRWRWRRLCLSRQRGLVLTKEISLANTNKSAFVSRLMTRVKTYSGAAFVPLLLQTNLLYALVCSIRFSSIFEFVFQNLTFLCVITRFKRHILLWTFLLLLWLYKGQNES